MPRRELRFSSLEQVKSDVLKLHTQGYAQTGKWDLSQMTNHLADWMSFPMDGFPPIPFPINILVGIMRVVQGKTLYKKFVEKQRMSDGQPTSPVTVHKSSDENESVQRFLSTIDRLASYRDPLHPSPLFGALKYDELIALQLAHCAHHLSFLSPK